MEPHRCFVTCSPPCCIFASSLAAVARTDFDFAAHIRYKGAQGDGYRYQVKLYHHQTQKPQWVSVHYNGTRDGADMGHADRGEFWTVLYLRAYANMYGFELSELDAEKNDTYRNSRTAMQSITGQKSGWNDFQRYFKGFNISAV